LLAATAREQLPLGTTQRLHEVADILSGDGIVIDATASQDVAGWHARWLEQGLIVVTANKAGTGGSLSNYRAIARHGERYGDAATVGAGLPLLRSLRELRAGGDRILGLAGVLSGSLAWLFDRYDGMRPFSELVREARALGYTEPDPRLDLSGQDVKRKLLILARNAGFALEENAVEVESLLPDVLIKANAEQLDAALPALDAPLRERFQAAYKLGRRLRFIARLDAEGHARVGLEALEPNDPLAVGSGCDNRVALWSCRYAQQPLVIQGPGAGAEVTAAALLDDVLRLAR
jgi:homoserine dehydrogenase